MSPRALRLASLLLVGTLSASALDLSGTVQLPDGTPKAGVTVVLASTGESVLTNASGSWSMGSGSTSTMRRIPSVVLGGHLALREGRLSLAYQGMDVAGRALSGRGIASASARLPLAARTASVPDTLVYSFQGRIFLRDTVSAARSAMVRVYDTTWNAAIVYGYLTDVRDGQTYKTVKIGTQVWMAQNLNVKLPGIDSGWAYNNSPDSARKYGRLYYWASAVGLADSCNRKVCSTQVTAKRQGICPSGWHVPRDSEWIALVTWVESMPNVGVTNGGRALKAVTGWKSSSAWGWDHFGFRALPAGYGSFGLSAPSFTGAGITSSMWSASEINAGDANIRNVAYGWSDEGSVRAGKREGNSIRCRED